MSVISPTMRRRRFRPDARIATIAEAILIPVGALIVAALVFSVFLLVLGKDPVRFFGLVWTGGAASAFSLQNTLQRAAPLILTGLAFAVPARIGLTLLGAEGALVLGGFTAAVTAIPMIQAGWSPWIGLPLVAGIAMSVGGVWVGLAGWLRHYRGVNETISSLLLTYIAIAIMNFLVEGVFRDPGSTNKASTMPLSADWRIGDIPGTSVHWGLVAGLILAALLWILMERTTFGFSARIAGGNLRAAQAQGLPVGRLAIASCAIAGACAGLAGFFEVVAVHGQANASLAAKYGFTGILVAFLARQNTLAVVPVACLFGALAASGGLVQRRMDMPDATMLVLQGIIFVTLLVSETFYGRLPFFRTSQSGDRT